MVPSDFVKVEVYLCSWSHGQPLFQFLHLHPWKFGEVLPGSFMHLLPVKVFPFVLGIPSWWVLSSAWSSLYYIWCIDLTLLTSAGNLSHFSGWIRVVCLCLCVCVCVCMFSEHLEGREQNMWAQVAILNWNSTSYFPTTLLLPDICINSTATKSVFLKPPAYTLPVWCLLNCIFLHFKPISTQTNSQGLGSHCEAIPGYYNKLLQEILTYIKDGEPQHQTRGESTQGLYIP